MVETGPGGVRSEQAEFKDPEDESSPWWLLNFYLELPFYLPYLWGATFNVELPYEQWVSPSPDTAPVANVLLKVIQWPTPPPPDPSPATLATLRQLLHDRGIPEIRDSFDGDWQPSPPPLHIVSIVEAVTPKILLQSEEAAGLRNHPDTYLGRCLAAVNLWVRAITVATGRTSVRTISRENLPMFQAFFHQRPRDAAIVKCDFIRVNENRATSPNSIATKNSVEQIRRSASSIDDSHAIWKAAEWRAVALRLASIEGRHDLAVVALNTAFEVLLFGLARVLLVDEGESTPEIDRRLGGQLSLLEVCHRFLQPRIGGSWDATNASREFGAVIRQIVKIRNDVAHQGLSVSFRQAEDAFMSYIRFSDFLARQVGARRKRYPRAFMDLVNAFNAPAGVTVGAGFSEMARGIVETTPRYWLPANDSRQTAEPPVFVYSTPGRFPTTARREMVAEWETTAEPFMHLVSVIPPVSPTDDERQDA